MVIMGNKCDLEDQRKISKEQAEQWCKENGDLAYFETSAVSNIQVEDGFMKVVKLALDSMENDDMQMPDSIGGMGIKLDARRSSTLSAYKRNKKCKC